MEGRNTMVYMIGAGCDPFELSGQIYPPSTSFVQRARKIYMDRKERDNHEAREERGETEKKRAIPVASGSGIIKNPLGSAYGPGQSLSQGKIRAIGAPLDQPSVPADRMPSQPRRFTEAILKLRPAGFAALKTLDAALAAVAAGTDAPAAVADVPKLMATIAASGDTFHALKVFVDHKVTKGDKYIEAILDSAPADAVDRLVAHCTEERRLHPWADFLFAYKDTMSRTRPQRDYIYYCIRTMQHDAARAAIRKFKGSLMDHQGISYIMRYSNEVKDRELERELRQRECERKSPPSPPFDTDRRPRASLSSSSSSPSVFSSKKT